MTENFDVAIVGGGPAGCAAAIRLAVAGLKVVLVEQKRFPREKLCGEFISPECLIHFKELGVLLEMSTAGGADLRETIFFSRSGKSVTIDSRWFGNADSLALGLSRAEMDSMLLKRSRAQGADVREETTATGLVFERDRVVGIKLRDKSGIGSQVNSKIVIDATGRSRSLARRLDQKGRAKAPADFVAFKAHLRGADLMPAACEIYVYKGGYGGCNSVEGELYNLCFIASAEQAKSMASDPERVMREVLFANSRASKALADVEIASEWLAVPITRFGRGSLAPANGMLCIGDAAAFIDPFTGSGILLALESGKIAADLIARVFESEEIESLAQKYSREYSKAFDSRLRFCSLLRQAAFMPLLAETTISILSLSSSIRRTVARATRIKA